MLSRAGICGKYENFGDGRGGARRRAAVATRRWFAVLEREEKSMGKATRWTASRAKFRRKRAHGLKNECGLHREANDKL